MTFTDLLLSCELGLIFGFLSLGIYITLRLINFTDLTCTGSFTIGAATAAQMIFLGYNCWLATLASFLAGGAAGALTAFLHIHMRISDIFSGIITAYTGYSIGLHILKGAPNRSFMEVDNIFTQQPTLLILFLLVIFFAIIYVFFFSTRLGLAMQVAGYKPWLAQQFHVKTTRMITGGLTLSNALIGLSGGVMANYQEFFDITQGTGTLITGLSIALLGEKIFPLRSLLASYTGCFVGAIAYQTLISFAIQCTSLGLEPYDINIILAILMVLLIWKRKSC
ncbi:MAG: ABC transporter permease [Alphaproteobacteria bacterium]|nr:ABC transporter permease [Alphaproteobacteria bacterium]